MTGLDSWLTEAARCLAPDAIAQVRSEIQEHYESALDAAVAVGATVEQADKLALRALGDAKTANRQYRRVLLTSAEAKMLREGQWEASAICTRPWLKGLMLGIPMAALAVSAVMLFAGHAAFAGDLLLCAVGMGSFLAAPFLPIYTPTRSLAFRLFKWVTLTGALLLVLGSEAMRWSWLLFSCLWPLAWIEWTRLSIRRKLPVKAWPRHLYL